MADPLHQLLDQQTPWAWGKKEAGVFRAVKQLLTSNAVLAQYSESLPLLLACDTSPYGVGAVLSHQLSNGTEIPIAFFSRILAPTKRNCGQIEKETLAIVAGVKRFHNHL